MSESEQTSAAFIYYLKKTFTSNVEDFQVRTKNLTSRVERLHVCFCECVFVYVCVF